MTYFPRVRGRLGVASFSARVLACTLAAIVGGGAGLYAAAVLR